jgi:hypothetical protein
MEGPSSSETAVHCQQTTRLHVPEDKITREYECQKRAYTTICSRIFIFSPNKIVKMGINYVLMSQDR